MSSPSYAPAGESEFDLWTERSNFNGAILAGWAYGVMFTVFLACISKLLWPVRGQTRRPSLIIYSIIMFCLGTIFVAANTRFSQLTFIDNRDFPGGPNNYTVSEYNNVPINLTGNVVFVITNWLADGLLMYRCLTIWSFQYSIIVLPVLMYMASLGLGATLCAQLARPNLNLWTHLTVSITIPYFSISLSLNVFLTLLIIGRLLWHRHVQRQVLGTHHASKYTTIATMLIESAAIYSSFSLIFIVSFARSSNVQNLFLPTLGEMQIVAPLLIILRVASGEAWQRDTAQTTTMKFTPNTSKTVRTGSSFRGVDGYPMQSMQKTQLTTLQSIQLTSQSSDGMTAEKEQWR